MRVYAAPYVDWFAAATLEEALAVRAAAPHTPILIFGGLLDPEIIQAAQHGLTINVFSLPYASHVQALLQPLDLQIDVHIKVDTGMSRLGFLVREGHFDTGVESIAAACALVTPISPLSTSAVCWGVFPLKWAIGDT